MAGIRLVVALQVSEQFSGLKTGRPMENVDDEPKVKAWPSALYWM